MNSNRMYWAVLLAASALAVLILGPSLIGPGRGGIELAALARIAFSRVCHQDLSRSFLLNQVPLPVCARCTGVYLGFAIGWAAVGVYFRKRAPGPASGLLTALCFAPLVVDGALNLAGVVDSPAMLRLATGLVFGIGAARAILPGLAGLPDVVRNRVQLHKSWSG